MAAKKILLIKIASEINIGKESIVLFLQSKGFNIENKPSATLTEEMVEAVYDKFKKEKKAAEKQKEKIEKQKQIRKVPESQKSDFIDTEEYISIKKDDEEEIIELIEKEEKTKITEIFQPIEDEEKVKSTERAKKGETEEKDIKKEKVAIEEKKKEEKKEIDEKFPVGKVIEELVKPGKKGEKPQPKKVKAVTKSDKKTKIEKYTKDLIRIEKIEKEPITKGEVKPIPKEKQQEEKKISDDKQVTKKVELVTSVKVQEKVKKVQPLVIEKAIAVETAKEEKEKKIVEQKPKVKVKPVEEISEEQKELVLSLKEKFGDKSVKAPVTKAESLVQFKEPTPLLDDTVPKEKKSKRRRRRKKIAEVEIEPGQAPKLRGLTIVGRIDLEKEKAFISRKEDRLHTTDIEEEDDFSSKSGKFKKKGKGKAKEKPLTLKERAAEKKKKKKRSIRELISEEDVNKAIKETLSGIDDTTVGLRSKMRMKRRHEREEKELKKHEEEERKSHILELTEFVTTSDLAKLIGVSPNEIILKCMELGLMVGINQRLDKDTITLISDDYNFQVEFLDEKEVQEIDDIEDIVEQLEPRPPIVTIMGHVDHGKTSLIDFIRKTNVVAGEAGLITQHIGAYRTELPGNRYITFLDTPGHEAFTSMRARGAQVTDIVVLVVAADDSVMPQTIEAISHSQAANVKIIVAINKIDKPDANPDRIKQQLADKGVLVEEWGGNHQCVEISAKFGNNVDVLLDKILLEAEMLDLKANPNRKAKAAVIEAKMEKGHGPVATVIVQKGTLKVGECFVAGCYAGKVRKLLDERENSIEMATPSMAVRVVGFEGLPQAGDILNVVNSDTEARGIANKRMQLKREQEFRQIHHVTLDEISKQIQIGGIKELNLIIKGDVGGSVEALADSLQKLSREEVQVVILHKGVGAITESDIMLAIASGAIIIGFQIGLTSKAKKLSETESVDIRTYNIIYDCIDEIKLALEGLLTPETKEEIVASIEVRKVFKVSKSGNIAGCYIQSGKITRNDKVRLLRKGLPVFTGGIQSLKRNKDDVREVDTGYECGIMLDGWNDIQSGDIIEAFKIIEVKRTFH